MGQLANKRMLGTLEPQLHQHFADRIIELA